MKTPIQSAGGAVPVSQTSLTAAIYRYRGVWNLYLAESLETEERGEKDDVLYDRTSRRVLENWDRPAESLVEAQMALEFALTDYDSGDSPCIPAMMNAALGWLTAEQKRRQHAIADQPEYVVHRPPCEDDMATADAMRDLEDKVHDLSHMTGIMSELIFEAYATVSGPDPVVSERALFSVNEVTRRVKEFRKAYMIAYGDQPQEVAP